MYVALVHNLQGLVKELCGAFLCLFLKAFALTCTHFQQWQGALVFCHQHVAHMRSQSVYKISGIKTLGNDVVNQHHYVAHLVFYGKVDDVKVIVTVKHVEVGNYTIVGKVALCKAGSLVEYGERITHTAIRFLGNHGQGFLFVGNTFILSHTL